MRAAKVLFNLCISPHHLYREAGESGEGAFVQDSDIKFTNQEHNDSESYWNHEQITDEENDNWLKFIDQIMNDSGSQSDEEEKQIKATKEQLSNRTSKPVQKTDTDEYRLKSVKPNAKILRKNMESHLNAAKLKNLKETSLKGKLKKTLSLTEKQTPRESTAANLK